MDNNTFTITDDKTADWAVKQIKEAEEERDRLIKLAEEEIADLEAKIEDLKTTCDNQTGYLKSCLAEYFYSVPHKETKTQETYKLISGSLVFKKASQKINHDDGALIAALDGSKYVETKKTFKWGEYKKNLQIIDDKVILAETGEIIEACTVEDVPPSFDIKFS